MAKSQHVAARAFDVGGEEVTHFEARDPIPANHPHLEQLVKDGYVSDGSGVSSKEAIDPATNLPVKDAEVYEENEGSVADSVGTEVDVVGDGTPDAEDVQVASPKKRASAKSTSGKRK